MLSEAGYTLDYGQVPPTLPGAQSFGLFSWDECRCIERFALSAVESVRTPALQRYACRQTELQLRCGLPGRAAYH